VVPPLEWVMAEAGGGRGVGEALRYEELRRRLCSSGNTLLMFRCCS